MHKLKRDLFAGLASEIKHQLRYNPRIKGLDTWKIRGKTSRPYIHEPVFPILVDDKRESGRSSKYHAERVDEMALRGELGMDLWGKDEEADREDFVGTELTEKEREFIGSVLNAASKNSVTDAIDGCEKIKTAKSIYQAKRRSREPSETVKADVVTGRRTAYPNKYNHDHTI